MKKTAPLWLSILFLILAQVVVGFNIVASKFLVADFPTLFLLIVRFSGATLILLVLCGLTQSPKHHWDSLKKVKPKTWGFIVAQALTAGTLFNLMMVIGLHYTNANVAGIVTSLLPMLTMLMAALCLKERLTLTKWMCILLATIGLIVINTTHVTGADLQDNMGLGCLIIMVGLVAEAAYYILTKLHPVKMSVFLLSALMNGINAVLLLPIAFFFIPWSTLEISAFQAIVLGLASLSSALFYLFWYLGSEKVDGSMASLSTAVMPIATIIISWIALGEGLSPAQALGMVLIIIAIIFCAQQKKSRNH
jgi:drug/metabolite transporter (DMT)-like permease